MTFEAVGVPQLQADCVEAARPGGKAVLVGLSAMGSSTPLSGAKIVRQEKTVIGSYYGTAHTARDFPFLLDLYAAGKLDLDRAGIAHLPADRNQRSVCGHARR